MARRKDPQKGGGVDNGPVAMPVHLGGAEYLVVRTVLPSSEILSKAELEVAQLAAAGASNQRIAEARGVSVRTVANQLALIFDKLGIARRYQLASVLSAESPERKGRP